MNVTAVPSRQWMVSTRPSGDVVVAWAGGDDLRLGVFALPGHFSADEYEAWLGDLLGVSRETARTDTTFHAIPAILRQALTGLLFSHAELWEQNGGGHTSVAFAVEESLVSFGWVGEGEVEVAIDGHPVEVSWVHVRDAEGREARAATFDARSLVTLELGWTPGSADGATVRVAASWGADAAPDDAMHKANDESRFIAERQTPPSIEESSFEPSAALDAEPAPLPQMSEPAAADAMPEWRSDESSVPSSTGPASSRPARGWFARIWNWVMGSAGASRAGRGEPAAGAGGFESLERDRWERDEVAFDPHLRELGPPASGSSSTVATDWPSRPSLLSRREELPIEAPSPEPAIAPDLATRVLPIPETPPTASAAPPPVVLSTPQAPPPEPSSEAEAPAVAAEVAFIEFEPPSRTSTTVRIRPRWPTPEELKGPKPVWSHRWFWGAAIALLFGGGYVLGNLQSDRVISPGEPSPIQRALRAIGLGPARYAVDVQSSPPGAWIAVDGHDLSRRTPSQIEIAPGAHQIELSYPDLGSASFPIRGSRGDHVTLSEPMWGSLLIEQSDTSIPLQAELDGRELGYVPVRVDTVAPGPHEIRFSGPGMTPWAQTLEVRVRQEAQLVARPITSPSTGELVVKATLNNEAGNSQLEGAEVWIDGEKRGHTPLTIELPRGPHSIRVAWRGASAPVTVIDLPGGNQRFANFELGGSSDAPHLALVSAPERVPSDKPALISGTLDGVTPSEIHEMWLHVRGPDGAWGRYPLQVMKAPDGVLGVSVFPPAAFDASGRASYYLSALTRTGDEYFTEITLIRTEGGRP